MSIWTALSELNYQHTYVDAAGLPTRAVQAGPHDGEHVVFLHGTSGHLEAFVRNLPAHARQYRCHAIDMLGHGYTAKPDYPYDIPSYVEHLLGYLDAVGAERAHLIGESLGGWVAAWAASEHPERVASLQLLRMGGTKVNPEVMERLKKSTTAAARGSDRDLTRQRLRLLWADWDDELGEELTDVRYAIYHRPEFQKNLHNLLSLQEFEARERNLLRPDRMAQITAPTLVVWGNKNPFGQVRRTGLAKASAYRLAQELLQWGLLERVGSDYRLGLRLFELGQRVPRQRILREAALPFMQDLLLATQETIHFAIHDGLDVVYVEKIIMHRGLSQHSRIAGRLPLHCTATGKIILAFSTGELIEQVLQAGLTPLTQRTVTSPGVLIGQVKRARETGIATEFEEIRLGYGSLAVPVFGGDQMLAGALSITAPTSRLNVSRLTGSLLTAALGIGRKLQAIEQ